MLENPTPTAADAAPAIKRYAPPNQRNRSLGRRKSGDRFDWTNNVYGNDSEKNQGATSRNINPVGDAGSSAILNEDNPRHALIPLEGCSRSDASRLLSNRWAAVLHRYHDTSIDLSERPVLYSGISDSAWRNVRLPHQMMSPANNTGPSSGSQMDFLAELRRAIRNANTDN
ncbi:hypothetical protein ERO13_D11G152400v2 [Gossypium hirsutum]|uniref:Uncharacterized protein isoform X1 n=5 Tax=Gossypium TaxID=3633 RepID=A0A1U8K0Y8_GOSHI|nr:uncharacterized protein LOC107912489 isoform X1 [Gossypium hirsutum]KAB2003860.1 hypothetical protein ES319_D11G159700v1 [Gossypium barbadense]TYG45370.1 hypothetical protein ES288_D11G168200v1 [Gossypium darwinii]TYH44027.1 hypothetical protein ES332_D11G165900v1 [Gossypium tomentosum]TYI55757.1 hypothetical protein E1A91_D11G163200v1 [Gossypium mustelinum]KAG4120585.1 hypothetical protein ERO13_D11G152400v2 [Gossypium hirsutum]